MSGCLKPHGLQHTRLPCPSLFNESALHIRWPKYWSFSFSISPSNEYSGLFLPTFWIMQGYWNTNYRTIALISHASKVMLKILQARFQQYMNHELPDVQAGFRKGQRTRGQIANISWIIEKARKSSKHLFLLYWLCQSLWLCGSQQTVENSERDGNTRPPDQPLEKPMCRFRKQQLELDMEQQTGSK